MTALELAESYYAVARHLDEQAAAYSDMAKVLNNIADRLSEQVMLNKVNGLPESAPEERK